MQMHAWLLYCKLVVNYASVWYKADDAHSWQCQCVAHAMQGSHGSLPPSALTTMLNIIHGILTPCETALVGAAPRAVMNSALV